MWARPADEYRMTSRPSCTGTRTSALPRVRIPGLVCDFPRDLQPVPADTAVLDGPALPGADSVDLPIEPVADPTEPEAAAEPTPASDHPATVPDHAHTYGLGGICTTPGCGRERPAWLINAEVAAHTSPGSKPTGGQSLTRRVVTAALVAALALGATSAVGKVMTNRIAQPTSNTSNLDLPPLNP